MKMVFKQYLLVNKYDLTFADGDYDTTDDIEEAFKYDSDSEAISDKNNCDCPEDWEVREITTIYQIGKVIE